MTNLKSTLSNSMRLLILLLLSANIFGQGDASAAKNNRPKLIRGDVFIIEKTTTSLPRDFSKLQPITSIFVSEINVQNRSWNNGFPDLPEIYEWFAIEYTATFRINQDGNFKFRLVSDDGAKLYIDRKLVVDNDGVHNFLPAGGAIRLAKGDHTFRLQFFQGPRYEAGLQLFVKKDGSKETLFPGDDVELLDVKSEDQSNKP